ncbi:cytochrome P450 [Daedalea quercina L-15889]|uniref:Cytochrome P450 n=1 Tax=Daedalea quercina L-15889 TaxID=1314783 RepID=A0A165NDK3_9APHY|nr:cytochrome P450 [Daedalea quercina L-15889]
MILNLILISSVTFLAYRYVRNARQLPLPPGPRGLPLLGNAWQIPNECSWLTFARWAKTYGPVMYISVVGSPIIVLSSREAITDLLEKKNLIYSDRPVIPMAGELAGCKKYTAMLPYCPRHREGRKMILGALSARKAPELHAIQEAKAVEFVSRLLRTPIEYRAHIRWLVAASVLQIGYGIKADAPDDPYLLAVAKSLKGFSEMVAPGVYLVDGFPSLKYIPEWFPGAHFKRRAREVGETISEIEKSLYQVAQEAVERGEATPSFVADFLTQHPGATPEERELCREVAAQFYGAGSDTTVSALLSFFLIMAQCPHVQQKAQAEVDAVVGDRSPKCSDRDSMPYLEAVLKEVHRWNPVLPIALPHQVRHEDTYASYRIPTGSTVFANTWAVLHDPTLYPDPEQVIPERYIDGSDPSLNPDPRDFSFGYGRRVCPGRSLAEDTLFIVAASVLAAFNLSSAVPLKGEKIKYHGGIINHPDEFRCTISPRRPT